MKAAYESTILLPDTFSLPMAIHRNAEGEVHSMARDSSFLTFFIEELIANSASYLAIIDNDVPDFVLEEIPETVKNRVLILSKKHLSRAIEIRNGLLGPIVRELKVYNHSPDELKFYSANFGKTTEKSTAESFVGLFIYLGIFLLGMDQKLWIEIDIKNLKNDIHVLRSLCKDPQSRMNLASIEGILQTYTVIDTPMLKAVPTTRPQLIDTFRKLLEDETYIELLRATGKIGLPHKVNRTLVLMRRWAEKLVLKPGFRHLFELGTKAVTVATHVPLPGPTIADTLKYEGFLPPVTNLDVAWEGALSTWEKQTPRERRFKGEDIFMRRRRKQ